MITDQMIRLHPLENKMEELVHAIVSDENLLQELHDDLEEDGREEEMQEIDTAERNDNEEMPQPIPVDKEFMGVKRMKELEEKMQKIILLKHRVDAIKILNASQRSPLQAEDRDFKAEKELDRVEISMESPSSPFNRGKVIASMKASPSPSQCTSTGKSTREYSVHSPSSKTSLPKGGDSPSQGKAEEGGQSPVDLRRDEEERGQKVMAKTEQRSTVSKVRL